MRLIILDNYDKISDYAANYVCKGINEFEPADGHRFFCLGLPTGSSPLGFYSKLVGLHKSGKLSFRNVCTFNMDEYCGLPERHPESYHFYMWDNFFRQIDIRPENVNILNGNALDLSKECEQFEEKIKSCGGIDIFVGGLGADGHIAFNMPGTSLKRRTHIQDLNFETVVANSRFFDGKIENVPKKALTVGVGTIMDAREVLVIVNGSHKARALHKSIESSVNHMWPASSLQLHPNSIWVVDEDATLELKVRTYKHHKQLLSNYLFL